MGSLRNSDVELEDPGGTFSTPSESTDTFGGGDIVFAEEKSVPKVATKERWTANEWLKTTRREKNIGKTIWAIF